MDRVGGIQSAAVGLPTTAERRQVLAHSVSLVYRVLVPASPAILALGFGVYVPAVLSLENIINIIQQTAFLFVLTCAQTIVLLTRGLDLSLGPSVSMISVASALTMTVVVGSDGSNGIIAALAGTASGLLIGLLVGLFNGIAVAWLRVNPFVATLASMNICLGIGTSLSDGHPVFGIPEEFNVAAYRLHVLGIPMSIIYAVAVGIALHLEILAPLHQTVDIACPIIGPLFQLFEGCLVEYKVCRGWNIRVEEILSDAIPGFIEFHLSCIGIANESCKAFPRFSVDEGGRNT